MSTAESRYELRLADRRTVTRLGRTPQDAITRHLDAHPDSAPVLAWRHADRYGLFPGVTGAQIDG